MSSCLGLFVPRVVFQKRIDPLIKFLASLNDVLAVKIDQTVDRRDLQQITDRLDTLFDRNESIALSLDVRGLERLSMAALLDDLSYSLRRRFVCAVALYVRMFS